MKANITQDMIDAISKKQIEVLQKWWDENATIPMKMQAEGKTMKGALAFIRSVARTVAQDGMAMISDEDTYGLLVHYMADEQEGATYGGSDETKKKKKQPAHVETEAEKLEKMTDEERKAYIERKNAEEKARKAAEEERNRKIAERTAKEAAKAAKAAALKKAAEAQLLFNF